MMTAAGIAIVFAIAIAFNVLLTELADRHKAKLIRRDREGLIRDIQEAESRHAPRSSLRRELRDLTIEELRTNHR